MPTSGRSTGAPSPRWGLLVVVVVGSLVIAAVAGFLGLLFGSEFAAGERAPIPSAIFWALSALVAAMPVVSLALPDDDCAGKAEDRRKLPCPC